MSNEHDRPSWQRVVYIPNEIRNVANHGDSPVIELAGDWLAGAGFPVGTTYLICVEVPGHIILQVIDPHDDGTTH